MQEELEKQRAQKRKDDAAKNELKARTKALEDQKRTAESTKREVEKRLKAARSTREGAIARTERLEREVKEFLAQVEAHGAEIVSSGVETSALVDELLGQVEVKKKEVRDLEEEITSLSAKVREMEEKVAAEEKRLEKAQADAEARRQAQEREHEIALSQIPHSADISPDIANVGTWHALPHLQTNYVGTGEAKLLERSDVFPSSPVVVNAPESPLSLAGPEQQVRRGSLSVPTIQHTTSNGTTSVFFDSDHVAFPHARNTTQIQPNVSSFSPFGDTPGPLSPTSESLIPSTLYEPLGMAGSLMPSISSRSVGMDVSRSFQSEDDVILDRDWLNHRNRSAGDVGQPFQSYTSSLGGEPSPVSPTASVRGDFSEYEALETHQSAQDRVNWTRMDAQRAAFPRPFVSDYVAPQISTQDRFTESAQMSTPIVASRRSGWFSSSKDPKEKEKGTKEIEKKGLNPDAKEFSLSKDKERSFTALLSRSKGSSTPGSGSGSSSTPSTASLPTPELSTAMTSSSTSSGIPLPSPTLTHPSSRATPSLFGFSSSWFSSSRAFAPTPTEREQLSLSKVLTGSSNPSLDRLPSLSEVGSLPASPQPAPALAHVHSTSHVRPPVGWLSEGLPHLTSKFSPFADEPLVSVPQNGVSNRSVESTSDAVVGRNKAGDA